MLGSPSANEHGHIRDFGKNSKPAFTMRIKHAQPKSKNWSSDVSQSAQKSQHDMIEVHVYWKASWLQKKQILPTMVFPLLCQTWTRDQITTITWQQLHMLQRHRLMSSANVYQQRQTAEASRQEVGTSRLCNFHARGTVCTGSHGNVDCTNLQAATINENLRKKSNLCMAVR